MSQNKSYTCFYKQPNCFILRLKNEKHIGTGATLVESVTEM